MKGTKCSALIVAVLLILAVGIYVQYAGFLRNPDNSKATTLVKQHTMSSSDKHARSKLNRKYQDKPFLFTAEKSDAVPELEVSTVHYLWCDRKFFRFENYVSLMSVVMIVRPMKIVFHYTSHPQVDGRSYFTWFDELKRKIPNLVLHHLGDNHVCKNGRSEKLKTAWEYVNKTGGLYVGENTIFKVFPSVIRKKSLAFSVPESKTSPSVAGGVIFKHVQLHSKNELNFTERKTSHSEIRCCFVGEYENDHTECYCVIAEKTFYPKDIWTLPTSFGDLTRWITYGQVEKMEPKPNSTELTPRISHYLWFGSRYFDYSHYLSVLSCLYVAGMHRVYFHGHIEPTGPIWQKVKKEENVSFVFTDPPEFVYNQRVNVPQHWGDVAKVYSLLKYGGISQDPDVFWVNYVTDEMLAYDSILAFDWVDQYEWPESFNIGVFIAKKNSKYVRELLLTFKDYRDNSWGHNAINMPYRVYERFPNVLWSNPHLQVLCFRGKCHPTWLPNHKEPQANGKDHAFDWKTEAISIHVTLPKPPNEFKSLTDLKQAKGLIAEFGKMILKKAGKWEDK